MLGVHELRQDLSGMAARIEMIGMSVGFAFRSLFATVTGENVLVVIVVEVLVFVDVVVIGHSFCFCCIAHKERLGRNA